MANWDKLKLAISNTIKTNGNKEITGQLLQQVLLNIVTNVGANATFAGLATPATNPGILDGPVFYIANTQGLYSNFNNTQIKSGETAVLIWTNGTWNKSTLISDKIERIELECTDDIHVVIKGTSDALSYSQVKAFVDDTTKFVTLKYLDMWWMLPAYDDGGAIEFTSATIVNGHIEVTRVIMNTDSILSNYTVTAEDIEHKTDDLAVEAAADGHYTYPTTHAINAAFTDVQNVFRGFVRTAELDTTFYNGYYALRTNTPNKNYNIGLLMVFADNGTHIIYQRIIGNISDPNIDYGSHSDLSPAQVWERRYNKNSPYAEYPAQGEWSEWYLADRQDISSHEIKADIIKPYDEEASLITIDDDLIVNGFIKAPGHSVEATSGRFESVHAMNEGFFGRLETKNGSLVVNGGGIQQTSPDSSNTFNGATTFCKTIRPGVKEEVNIGQSNNPFKKAYANAVVTDAIKSKNNISGEENTVIKFENDVAMVKAITDFSGKKGLSTNDYTDEDKQNVNKLSDKWKSTEYVFDELDQRLYPTLPSGKYRFLPIGVEEGQEAHFTMDVIGDGTQGSITVTEKNPIFELPKPISPEGGCRFTLISFTNCNAIVLQRLFSIEQRLADIEAIIFQQ